MRSTHRILYLHAYSNFSLECCSIVHTIYSPYLKFILSSATRYEAGGGGCFQCQFSSMSMVHRSFLVPFGEAWSAIPKILGMLRRWMFSSVRLTSNTSRLRTWAKGSIRMFMPTKKKQSRNGCQVIASSTPSLFVFVSLKRKHRNRLVCFGARIIIHSID